MQMIQSVLEEISAETSLSTDELAAMQKLLAAVQDQTRQSGFTLSRERWLAAGIHLAAVIRRASKGEVFPALDQAVLEQVDPAMKEISRQVLSAAKVTAKCREDATEVLLLAVHFAAAQQS
jgi:hypothetical protein